jgi:hypothetical protein
MQKVMVQIPSKDELTLIQQYLFLTRGAHGLTDREITIAAHIIKHAKEENGSLRNVLDYEGRVQLRKELDLSEAVFNVMVSRLKKKGVIIGNKLSGFCKNIKYDAEGCELSIKLMMHAEQG